MLYQQTLCGGPVIMTVILAEPQFIVHQLNLNSDSLQVSCHSAWFDNLLGHDSIQVFQTFLDFFLPSKFKTSFKTSLKWPKFKLVVRDKISKYSIKKSTLPLVHYMLMLFIQIWACIIIKIGSWDWFIGIIESFMTWLFKPTLKNYLNSVRC